LPISKGSLDSSLSFPQLQVLQAKIAKARRQRLLVAIPSAPFLSGHRAWSGGGGEPGIHGAVVYRVHSFLVSPRFSSPLLLMVERREPVPEVWLLR
jgi:hypothetical protein